MRCRFLYLVAIRCPPMVYLQTMRGMDWHTRMVLLWRISNTLVDWPRHKSPVWDSH
jgi:hypothetical protein